MDADTWSASAELLALLQRNAPRAALTHPWHADTAARQRALAAVALEARLRVSLATRARRTEHCASPVPVRVVRQPTPPPVSRAAAAASTAAAARTAANLRLAVNHSWGLAARARAREAARRRELVVSEDVLNAARREPDEYEYPRAHGDGDALSAASAEELSGSDGETPASSSSVQPGVEPSEFDSDTASLAFSEHLSAASALEEVDSAGGGDTDASAGLQEELQQNCFKAETPTETAEDAVPRTFAIEGTEPAVATAQASELQEVGAAVPELEPLEPPHYYARRMLLSRLRLQQRSTLTGGTSPLLDTAAPTGNLVLGAAATPRMDAVGERVDGSASQVAGTDATHGVAELNEGETCLPALTEPSGEADAALPAAVDSAPLRLHLEVEVRPPADVVVGGASPVVTVALPPECDADQAAHFVANVLRVLVREQSHGRLLDACADGPLALPLLLLSEPATPTDRLLFDCANEALLLLTQGTDALTTLWRYRMTHLTEAACFDAVCRVLSRQLGVWLSCANADDTRERLRRQLVCEIDAAERAWNASVKQHVAELHGTGAALTTSS